MRVRRFLALLSVALAVLLMLVAGVLVWRGGEWARQALQAGLQARLLPQVELERPLQWEWRPQGRVVLQGLRLRGADAALLAEVDEVEVVFVWQAVLSAPLVLERLRLRGVRARLDVDEQGRLSAFDWWLPGASARNGAGALPRIETVELVDASLELNLAAHDQLLRLEVPALSIRPLAGAVTGALQGEAVLQRSGPQAGTMRLQFSGGLRPDVSGGVYMLEAVQATADVQASGWQVEGAQLALDRLGLGPDAALQVDGLSLQGALQGPPGVLSVQAGLARLTAGSGGLQARGEFRLQDGDGLLSLQAPFQLDGAQAAGQLAGRLQGSPFSGHWSWPGPAGEMDEALELVLAVERLDLDALRAGLPPAWQAGAGEGARDGTGMEGAGQRWESWPLSVELSAGWLRVQGVELSQARLRLGPPASRARQGFSR